MRGENDQATLDQLPLGGTSPRARGKPYALSAAGFAARNIPACAGKTVWPVHIGFFWREHPRVRGENPMPDRSSKMPTGTSPRARGKHRVFDLENDKWRNIPACAGKTGCAWRPGISWAEHPRVRGENDLDSAAWRGHPGTSPRARGKRRAPRMSKVNKRNIPACAGKTCAAAPSPQPDAEHPRVRGENSGMAGFPTLTEGTSPRARGKRSFQSISPLMMRNIPACAGKTRNRRGCDLPHPEHPRVRGEN